LVSMRLMTLQGVCKGAGMGPTEVDSGMSLMCQ